MTVQEMKLFSGTMEAWDQAEARRKRGKRSEEHAGHTVYIVEVDAVTGKLLPRAIVCCVCTGLLFRSLLTSWPPVRERERMGGFKMTDMAQ